MPSCNDKAASKSANENPVDLRALPNRTRQLAERVGIQRTYEFLVEFEASTLYIPAKLTNSTLAKQVGEDIAKALVELYPATRFTPNKIDKILQTWRNHELVHSDEPLITLCKKFKITRSRVLQIRQEHADNENSDYYQPKYENLTLDLEL